MEQRRYSTAYPQTEIDAYVVDLAPVAQRLLDGEDVSHLLTEDQENRLTDYIKQLLDISYSRISKRYDQWLEADRAHDVYVDPDATEFREKAVIPTTRAIADTVVTYTMAALTGRNPMFQLEGLTRKSRKDAAILERILHAQMRRGAGEARIAQLILDGVRYGFAPTKVLWSQPSRTNTLINFNPRRVFPDPRVQWGDWESAEYVGFVGHSTYENLKATGLYPKLNLHPELRFPTTNKAGSWRAHQWHQEEGRGLSIDPMLKPETTTNKFFQTSHTRIVDEVWLRMAGYQLNMPAIDQLWLVCAIIDEQVCIRFQLSPYGRQFPVAFGSLYHDVHKSMGQSLYDLLMPMHDIMTWLLRSRVDNVQAALNNLIFVDPTKVAISDLIDRNPYGLVRALPGADLKTAVNIQAIPDVTRGHLTDIGFLMDQQQRTSAASDAQQGVPTSDGIRTATEIARLTQLGSQRLGVLSRIQSAMTIRPMVRMMVGNIQDFLTTASPTQDPLSIRLPQDSIPNLLAQNVQDGYLDFTAGDISGEVEYLVVDGTLPVEPTRSPETWMNILTVMQQAGLNMEYDMGRIAEEAIKSMGVPDMDQFKLTQQQQQQLKLSQQLSLMEKLRGASVMPDDEVMNQVQKGNLIPANQVA